MRDEKRAHSRGRSAIALNLVIVTCVWWSGLCFGAENTRAFFEPLDVPLVSVDVYVTDADGRPVSGLKFEDFEILEDGELVQPTHFYAAPGAREQTAEPTADEPVAAPVTAPVTENDRVLLAIWFDETGLRPQRRRAAIEHLRGFLTEQLPDDVFVALVSYDGGTRVRLTFTNDRERVAGAIDVIETQGASASRLDAEQGIIRQIQNEARSASMMGTDGLDSLASNLLGEVQAFAAQSFQRTRHAFSSLGAFVDSLSVVPGQKIVLVVSDAIDPMPGERLFKEIQIALGPEAGLEGLSAMNFGRRYDLSRDFRELLHRANTNRVTFMTLSAMAERNLALTSAESRGGSEADMDQMMTEEQALLTMAGVTGGRVLENSGVLTQQLQEVAEEVASYYSLGYIPPTPADEIYHRLEVRVQREGVRVRHREGYTGTGGRSGLVERTVAAAVLDIADNPLHVSIEARNQEPLESGDVLVPILVRIPIGELVLVPGTTSHEGRVSLVVVVQSPDGGLSEPERREYPIEVLNSELVRATSSSAGYTLGLAMRPGPHRVAVGVKDDMGQVDSTVVSEIEVGLSE